MLSTSVHYSKYDIYSPGWPAKPSGCVEGWARRVSTTDYCVMGEVMVALITPTAPVHYD